MSSHRAIAPLLRRLFIRTRLRKWSTNVLPPKLHTQRPLQLRQHLLARHGPSALIVVDDTRLLVHLGGKVLLCHWWGLLATGLCHGLPYARIDLWWGSDFVLTVDLGEALAVGVGSFISGYILLIGGDESTGTAGSINLQQSKTLAGLLTRYNLLQSPCPPLPPSESE